MANLEQRTSRNCSPGSPERLGATLASDGVNFALFSQHSKEVFLLLFDSPDGPATDIIKISFKTDNIWHVFVQGLKGGQLYGYKINGEYNPKEGLRFNPAKLLIDPYAKALTGPFKHVDNLLFAYEVQSPDKDLRLDPRDNAALVPKSIVIDDGFDWQGDQRPAIAREDLIIYEMHLKGFTAHSSSGVQHPGSYLGVIEKIPHLQRLGINAVELLPVHEFFVDEYLISRGLTNYWGYNSIGFFAPSCLYRSGAALDSQVQEFKTMVRELHRAGIEVILDVVYNHTGEGNELGPTVCFKGIDNPTYYYLMQQTPEQSFRYYKNDTGCGNTFNAENPMALRLIMDSLRYWRESMHIDGFRFDLATALARDQGQFSQGAPFFSAIAQDPILKDVKMIAEPWDLTTYQVGGFPKGWMEWNGKYRDTVRSFLKGDEGQAPEAAKRLTSSGDFYKDQGRDFYESVNFVCCHDGFTLHDLFSYNDKHNEANAEDNKDGSNDNRSWNCGTEGDTTDEAVLRLRKQMAKNALCSLFFAFGTPMLLCGDEMMRTQKGNNNAWCQDNDISWVDWSLAQQNADLVEFCTKCIAFRKLYPLLGKDLPHINWYNTRLQEPRWDKLKFRTVCYQLQYTKTLTPEDNPPLFFIFNAHYRGAVVHLPAIEGRKWFRLIDTARKAGDDFYAPGKEHLLRQQEKRYCAARSVTVLMGKKL